MPAGFNSSADLLTQTVDGRDLNDLWADYQASLTQWNDDRNRLINFLSFPVTNPIEYVPVIGADGADFEEASEYGVPKGYRPANTEYSFGYDFKWYDIGSRFTWMFLAEAPVSQVDAVQNQSMEADNRLVYTRIMRRVFNPTNNMASIRGNPYNVYTFYNGAGEAPPNYKSNVFAANHTHFLKSNAAAIDPGDLEDHLEHLVHHGYDTTRGYKLVTMMNRTESEIVRLFRSGVNGATYDFIPALGTPALLLPVNVRLLPTENAQIAPTAVPGFKVVGTYGPLIIVEEDNIPTKYMTTFATGGPDSIQNPVGFREHTNAALRGMRLVKGRTADYPLIDSYYVRGFGTGVRHRGAGVVTQIGVGTVYAPPALFA